MNKILCKLTGGHKFSPISNPAVVRIIDDVDNNEHVVIDTCLKCGYQHISYIKATPQEMIFRHYLRENGTPYYEGRSIGMKEFIAKNPKQLDICLRLLYAEKVHFSVVVKETEKHKIEYRIGVHADEKTVESLREKYRILTS